MQVGELSPEQVAWLTANIGAYEFYLLHACTHDKFRRNSLLTIPVMGRDFSQPHHGLYYEALRILGATCSVSGTEFPESPTADSLKMAVRTAASMSADYTPQELLTAEDLCASMSDRSHDKEWYFLSTFFAAWFSSSRVKQYARGAQRVPIADAEHLLVKLQHDVQQASTAFQAEEDDPMHDVFYGEDEVVIPRRPTGIAGLDRALNGGWGDRECYLLFAGTGAGKSIIAAQAAWNEILTGGYPLIVSTELRQATYVMRILSNCCSIPIPDIGDLKNMKQVTNMLASKYPMKQYDLAHNLPLIQAKLRVAKIDAEAGIAAGSVLEREAEIYRMRHGRMPTLVIFDWLGSVADVAATGSQSSSDRAFKWELAATSCVKFADRTGISTLVLAQATNDSQEHYTLALGHIGIAKGIGKNMHCVVGVTNKIDTAGVKAAVLSGSDIPESTFLPDQFFCVVKARGGETLNVPVTREFEFQRFVSRSRNTAL